MTKKISTLGNYNSVVYMYVMLLASWFLEIYRTCIILYIHRFTYSHTPLPSDGIDTI